jgi:TatD DNase family protein
MLYPAENQYIDIHTHTVWHYPHIFSIRSLVKPEEQEALPEVSYAASVGLHPWFIEPGKENKVIAWVKETAIVPSVLAIGECGIDLKIGTAYGLQEKVFLKQAAIAEELKKPLVIHCVKAYQQLLNLIIKQKPSIPWIFHGFNNNEQVAADLIRQGAYLSIGADLLKENSKIRKALSSISLKHIFFETDEWQQPVWKLYTEASKLLSIPEKDLKLQVLENFKACFPFRVNEVSTNGHELDTNEH